METSLKLIKVDSLIELLTELKKNHKEEQREALTEAKQFLSESTMSESEKATYFMKFHSELSMNMIKECGVQATEIIIKDAQLSIDKDISTQQINVFKANVKESEADEALKKEELNLVKNKDKTEKALLEHTKIKTAMLVKSENMSISLTLAQIFESIRKSGAKAEAVEHNLKNTVSGISYDYSEFTFTPVEPDDMKNGLIGTQMHQLKNQGDSFAKHTLVQVAQQLSSLIGTGMDADTSNIEGLLEAHQKVIEEASELDFDNAYDNVGK